MSEAKFQLGDRVTIVPLNAPGEVVDVLHSSRHGDYLYEVKCFVGNIVSTYTEDDLEHGTENTYSMTINIDIAENVVIATLYEETADSKSILAKGHGHMIHEGELGIAQAASYACKRLYERLGGTITKGGSWR